MALSSLHGGVEAGGTKFVCIVGRGPEEILAEERFQTAEPDLTLRQVAAFFKPYCDARTLRAVGIGSFGPCDLDPTSSSYGHITSTPKPGWANIDLVGTITKSLGIPVAFDTDVNAAALGEVVWGAAAGRATCLYLTVGTGIGGGYVVDGRPLHGLQHPEMGHIRVPHDQTADPFSGSCPYHGDCLEGLASGPAIAQRFGSRGEELSDSDPFWEMEAAYLGAAIASYILILSPSIIVLGGGIMQRPFLLSRIRRRVQEQLAGYIRQPALLSDIDSYLVAPALGMRSGSLGAIALAASMSGEDLTSRGVTAAAAP